jgi:glycosyltransferase involved in cell wall biosynthesis
MDFTIITPSFNYGRYLRECLESVASQTGVSFEHLVMDACSTDDSADVVRDFSHVDFCREPDLGMSDGINKGFTRAKGEWVMWLNADDRLKPGALKAVKDFIQHQPEADVIYGAWDFMDQSGNFSRTMSLFPFHQRMLIHLGCYIGSTSTFLKRSSILDEGYFLNINFRYVMDGEYYARLAASGKKFVYFPKVLADFRIHGENLSFKNHQATTVDDCLKLQFQYSEARAIRRAYGTTWFSDENWNSVVDTFLQTYYRGYKVILKRLHRHKLKTPNS